ncbi:O-antigen ligase [Ruegeria sp. HKCCC2117]|uniref:O-antigen ligase family protein n=1 Tax=Ruegeria sp. HKCCC2117 TaxID=2682992 RepID=UPI001C2C54DD|nr:hypothetical protein [Ruegeria sp. HKCCC2117]
MTVRVATQTDTRTTGPLVLMLLLVSFAMPFYFQFLGLRLSGYRLILLVFMIPAVLGWLTGKAGKIRSIDLLVVAFAFWASLSFLVNHGVVELWQFVGIFMIETLVPYFIARTYIRSLAAFRYFVKWFLIVILILLPFAIFETVTGKTPLLDIFGKVLSVYQKWVFPPRLGLLRAQTTMPHPILFGVFCAPAFALCWYVLGWGKSLSSKLGYVSIVGGAVFCSLSSGAFLNVIIQGALMGWNWTFRFVKSKWKILLSGFGLLMLIAEIGSNRNVFEIFATHMTLTPGTAWARINTFNFATDDIMRNPIFGIGLNDWTRPAWMYLLNSVDNFWLVITMRHGFPGLFLLLGVVIAIYTQLVRKPLTGALADARLGYLISLTGLCVSAVTVHLWDATFCFLMFLLGACVWILDADETQDGEASALPDADGQKTMRYTRFPKDLPHPEGQGDAPAQVARVARSSGKRRRAPPPRTVRAR